MVGENRPHVLYVEDDAAVLELGVTALEEGGFSVATAATGAEAIQQLQSDGAGFIALVSDIDLVAGWTAGQLRARRASSFRAWRSSM